MVENPFLFLDELAASATMRRGGDRSMVERLQIDEGLLSAFGAL
jgi:hypothetical protein